MKNGYLIALLIVTALCAAVFGYYKLSKPATSHTAQAVDTASPFGSSAKSPGVNDIPGAKSSSLDPAGSTANDDPFASAKSTGGGVMTPNAIVTPVSGPGPSTQPSEPIGHSTTAIIPPAPIKIASSNTPSPNTGPVIGSTTQPSASSTHTGQSKHDAGTGAPIASAAAAGTATTYTVQAGDVLGTISQKTLGTAKLWKEIAKANPDVDPGHLKVGQVLKIPAVGKPVESAKQAPVAPAIDHSASTASAGNGAPIVNVADKSEKTDKPAKLAGPAPAANGQTVHVVEAGETLSSIARQAYPHGGGTWKTLFEANKSALNNDPNHLATGMKLIVPAVK